MDEEEYCAAIARNFVRSPGLYGGFVLLQSGMVWLRTGDHGYERKQGEPDHSGYFHSISSHQVSQPP
jgi:hypothetical protein